jgi:ParB family chromosome partitioning protein
MAPKRGLGKGMAALLSQNDEQPELEASINPGEKSPEKPSLSPLPSPSIEENGAVERMIPLEKLRPNPDQPRKRFGDEELGELADSIKEHGIIQPIIAEDAGDGTFIIIAGERRSRAAKIAGLTQAPVIVRNYSDEKRMVVSIIENVQREDLNPIEEAAAYKRLMELTGLSQDEAAAKVGKNRSTVANALRLLKLPPEMQDSVKSGGISPGHARAILSLDSPQNQDLLFREIIKKNLSVREAERRAAALDGQAAAAQAPAKKVPPGRAPELDAMEEKFIHHLGTKVAINGDLTKGAIVIDYYSMEDLDRLYEILGG